MVCVEKIQNDGLLVKLHDLKYLTSDEFYLVRKSNGHYARLNTSENISLVYREEFRNLVYDLAFSQQTHGQEIMIANIAQTQEKLSMLGQDPSQATEELL